MVESEYDIAICMPYFERIDSLYRTLKSFEEASYFDPGHLWRIQVSICDDGSVEEPIRKGNFDRIPMILTELPEKRCWKNACVPINRAVRATSAPLILLQSPETYHPMPVIQQMTQLIGTDYRNVVLCPTRVEGRKRIEWYAHPKIRPVKYWFCQLMSRDFFEEIGGFDEDYREGRCYEDDDFVSRVERSGGSYFWLEDCYVVHAWKPSHKKLAMRGMKNNLGLFCRKEKQRETIRKGPSS